LKNACKFRRDKNDDSLWNINGSPKIKNFKEHFGDEFNLKSSELIGLLEFSGYLSLALLFK
jgi:uncharacterized Fe-S radical SAM superfamily protein PflX